MSTTPRISPRKGALTAKDVIRLKHIPLLMTDTMRDAIGPAYRGNSWCIKAPSFAGKTNFVIQVMKDLAHFERVGFNSREEKLNASLKVAFERHRMDEVSANMTIVVEDFATWVERLGKKQSPKIWVIDSLQCFDMTKKDYERIVLKYPDTLFILISQVDPKGNPRGAMGGHAWSLSDVKIQVEGKQAFIENRLDGSFRTYTIWEEGAAAYYANGLFIPDAMKRFKRKAGVIDNQNPTV